MQDDKRCVLAPPAGRDQHIDLVRRLNPESVPTQCRLAADSAGPTGVRQGGNLALILGRNPG
jgi:hypothetical protein